MELDSIAVLHRRQSFASLVDFDRLQDSKFQLGISVFANNVEPRTKPQTTEPRGNCRNCAALFGDPEPFPEMLIFRSLRGRCCAPQAWILRVVII